MRANYSQIGMRDDNGRLFIEGDWYSRGLPPTVQIAENSYIDSSYGFAGFCSELEDGLILGEGSGCYEQSSFIVSPRGKVTIGKFSILNGSTILCKEKVEIGNHCMLAWGTVITDTWLTTGPLSLEQRQGMLLAAAKDSRRSFPFFGTALPVILEDNCWVGFDAVILPGVRLGRGCIVGCKSIVVTDIPPYSIVVGNPARIVGYLSPDDTEEARQAAFAEYLKKK